MIANPGFSFVGITGKHQIIPTTDTDLPIWGDDFEKTIIRYGDDLVDVYFNDPADNYDESPAIQFANIPIDDEEAIIKFCDKYGMLESNQQEANFRNDYLFHHKSKDDFSRTIPYGRKNDILWLGIVKREIASMRLLLDLKQAISENDNARMIEILTFFCFDLNRLCFEDAHWPTEASRFNYQFHRFAKYCSYDMKHGLGDLTFDSLIRAFLDEIVAEYKDARLRRSWGDGSPYPLMEQENSEMWRHIRWIFFTLLQVTTVENITPYGVVTFSPDIRTIDLSVIINEEESVLNTAKALLVDLFKERLHRVTPEVRFTENNELETSWKISSLLDAMYMDLFFNLSSSRNINKCANPTCNEYFPWSPSNPTKKYCSDKCAKCMATRMKRQREKKSATA